MNITKLQSTLNRFFFSGNCGVTINLDGSEFVVTDPAQASVDVVTLYSEVVDSVQLAGNPARVTAVAFILGRLLAGGPLGPRFVVGLFWLDDTHTKFSVDVNVLVDDKHRESTLAFAKQNGQQAIWSLGLGQAIPAGGSGAPGGLPRAVWDAVEVNLRAGRGAGLVESLLANY